MWESKGAYRIRREPPECCQSKKNETPPRPTLVTSARPCCRESSVLMTADDAADVADAVADAVETAMIISEVADAFSAPIVDDTVDYPAPAPEANPDYAPIPCEAFDGSQYQPEPEPVAEVERSFSYDSPAYDPPAPEPASYDSGGSSYDSGGYDGGSSCDSGSSYDSGGFDSSNDW